MGLLLATAFVLALVPALAWPCFLGNVGLAAAPWRLRATADPRDPARRVPRRAALMNAGL